MNFNRLCFPLFALLVLVSYSVRAQQTGQFLPKSMLALPNAQRIADTEKHAHTSLQLQKVQTPTDTFSHGDPTAKEQYILEMINRARANPTAEGVLLSTTTDADVAANYSYWHVDRAGLASAFAGYPVRPPLAFNARLIASARRHTKDMVDHNFQGHTGSDNSTLTTRLSDAGYIGWGNAGENVSAYATSLFVAHVGFNVDWGNADLGHRHNVMNFSPTDPIFTEIGIGETDVPNPPQNSVGPVVVTEDFGNAGGPYLTGVVYNDLNKNGFYDVGEGLAGVTIMPSSGVFYAKTSTSGGYAFPLVGVGSSITVTASGGALGGAVTKTVTLGSDNVKLDFNPSVTPAAVPLISPALGSMLTSTTAQFRWSKVTGATRYRFELSTDTAFATVKVSDSTLTDSTKSVAALLDGTTYYWRVQAKNANGWGAYSEVRMFSVVLLPAAITLVSPAQNALQLPSSVWFTWNRGAGNITRYEFQLATDVAMANLIADDSTLSDTSKLVANLDTNTTYHWRVRAMNIAGWGAWSSVRDIQVVASGIADNEAIAGVEARSTPNPFSDQAHFSFNLKKPVSVSLTLIGAHGALVKRVLLNERMEAGAHNISLDARALPSGTYYWHMLVDGQTLEYKVVLAK